MPTQITYRFARILRVVLGNWLADRQTRERESKKRERGRLADFPDNTSCGKYFYMICSYTIRECLRLFLVLVEGATTFAGNFTQFIGRAGLGIELPH